MTLTLPGLGLLTPISGAPDGVACWTTSSEGAAVAVLVEEPSTVDDLDADFIRSVLDDRAELVELARRSVGSALGEEVASAVEEPEFTFHTGQDWVLRFAECAAPGVSEMGVLVVFEGREVTEVDDLGDED